MPPFCASQFLRVPLGAAARRRDGRHWYSGKFSIRQDSLFCSPFLSLLLSSCVISLFPSRLETFRPSDWPIFCHPTFFFFQFGLVAFFFFLLEMNSFIFGAKTTRKKLLTTNSTRRLKQRLTAAENHWTEGVWGPVRVGWEVGGGRVRYKPQFSFSKKVKSFVGFPPGGETWARPHPDPFLVCFFFFFYPFVSFFFFACLFVLHCCDFRCNVTSGWNLMRGISFVILLLGFFFGLFVWFCAERIQRARGQVALTPPHPYPERKITLHPRRFLKWEQNVVYF